VFGWDQAIKEGMKGNLIDMKNSGNKYNRRDERPYFSIDKI